MEGKRRALSSSASHSRGGSASRPACVFCPWWDYVREAELLLAFEKFAVLLEERAVVALQVEEEDDESDKQDGHYRNDGYRYGEEAAFLLPLQRKLAYLVVGLPDPVQHLHLRNPVHAVLLVEPRFQFQEKAFVFLHRVGLVYAVEEYAQALVDVQLIVRQPFLPRHPEPRIEKLLLLGIFLLLVVDELEDEHRRLRESFAVCPRALRDAFQSLLKELLGPGIVLGEVAVHVAAMTLDRNAAS